MSEVPRANRMPHLAGDETGPVLPGVPAWRSGTVATRSGWVVRHRGPSMRSVTGHTVSRIRV